MKFFTGIHQVSDAQHMATAMFISVNRLRRRTTFNITGDWIMDSGAFSEISRHGKYRNDVAEYAKQIRRWAIYGNMLAAVSQDYMCEPHILEITGMTVQQHQKLTIERYDALLKENTGVYIMPVLQGYEPKEYVQHLRMYGKRFAAGAWVGVGSVCKRNADPAIILTILSGIKKVRPDLRLHGFGLKTTALSVKPIRDLLESADSMAWAFAAFKEGRRESWQDAQEWTDRLKERIDSPTLR